MVIFEGNSGKGRKTLKHIVLRGGRGVGKSYLLRVVLKGKNYSLGGFFTRREPGPAGEADSVYIHPAGEPEAIWRFDDENCVGRSREHRLLARYPAVFDTLGVQFLSGPEKPDIIVMDELGLMEKEAYLFQQAVLRALDGETPVLAVVKNRETDFLTAVCAHPRVSVYDVTPENRTDLQRLLSEQGKLWGEK